MSNKPITKRRSRYATITMANGNQFRTWIIEQSRGIMATTAGTFRLKRGVWRSFVNPKWTLKRNPPVNYYPVA